MSFDYWCLLHSEFLGPLFPCPMIGVFGQFSLTFLIHYEFVGGSGGGSVCWHLIIIIINSPNQSFLPLFIIYTQSN